MSNYCDSVSQYFCIITTSYWELVVFIVCCHFISLYYLPWEGPLLLLQAVQKALSRLFLSFCKDNHFFWESILFLLFFSLFRSHVCRIRFHDCRIRFHVCRIRFHDCRIRFHDCCIRSHDCCIRSHDCRIRFHVCRIRSHYEICVRTSSKNTESL